MAPLRLPQSYEMIVPALSTIDGLMGIQAIDLARDNAGAVISSAIGIEEIMKKVLLETVFNEVKTKKAQVEEFFLDSDWCSFNAKLQIILNLITQDQLMTGAEREELGTSLRKVMKSRNALAHGQMIWDGKQVLLQFFEAGPKRVTLDLEYWQLVETQFLRAFELIQALHSKVVQSNQ